MLSYFMKSTPHSAILATPYCSQSESRRLDSIPRARAPKSPKIRADISSQSAQSRCNVSSFRINTSKSVSKKTTLTSFRMNTYEKRGGGGRGTLFAWLLPFRQCRAAGEFASGSVTYILKVGDADFAGVEAIGGEIAQKGKEGDSLAERGILLGVL